MKRLIALCLMLVPSCAWAQKLEEPSPLPSSVTPPSGLQHTCSSIVVHSRTALLVCAETILSYNIAADGTVKDVVVFHSSGDAEVDKAAIGCVSTFKYIPKMQNGQLIEVPWRLVIRWNWHSSCPVPAAAQEPSR